MSRPESQWLFSSDSAREEATYETASTISAAALPDTSRYAAAAQPRQEKSPAYEMVAMKDGEASTKPSQQPPSVWNQWRVEILNCILMISMLCAMVVVFSLNNGKALPDWSSTISINTVVAVISAVLKASAALILAEGVSDAKWKWFQRSRSLHDFVVFDNASRGAWGCLQLLAAPRGGHYTASLGAGLILLTLALDPFTQQLVHHYDCRQAGETPWSKATLPRATRYIEAAAHITPGQWPPATPVLGFIDQGIYNPADIRTPFVCVTGNCTWEQPFSTLGFCATCEDMSSQLAFINISGEEVWPSRLDVATKLPSGTYTGPGSPSFEESWFTRNTTADGWIEIIQASMASPEIERDWSLDHYYASKMRDKEDRNGSGCKTAYENSTWACSGFGGSGAARCKLDPCVKTYKAIVEQGQLQEYLIGSHVNMFQTDWIGMYYWLAADLKCAGPGVVSRLRQKGFRIGDDDVIIPWNIAVNSSDGSASVLAGKDSSSTVAVPGPLLNETDLPLDIIPAECIYSMSYPPVSAIQRYLKGYLSGGLSPGSNWHSIDGPPQIRALYNDTFASFASVNSTFMSIAEGITQRIRRQGEPGSLPVPAPALGVTLEQRTCVAVRWPFLVFPAAVVSLTTAFLAFVVGRTALGGPSSAVAPGWKSSPLPMAFHGLRMDPDSTAVEVESVRHLEDMERASKRIKASLRE